MVRVEKQIFCGKQNISWHPDVEQYLMQYIDTEYTVLSTGDRIIIPKGFTDEYTGSKYTKKLRGGLAKTKANVAQCIGELIQSAFNCRYIENKDEKHSKDASGGWIRYDVIFEMCVKGQNEAEIRWNSYRGTLVIRVVDGKKYLYDLINIKKEARRPLES